ncbi:MAG: NAD(+) diphosphatase [Roseivirga sp.]|nr:NAD(+) diphosphatase [Roseivirga sp.]
MINQLHYISHSLDRDHLQRHVSIELLLSQGESLILPVWRSRNLFLISEEQTQIQMLHHTELSFDPEELIFLGHYRSKPLFTIDYSPLELDDIDWMQPDYRFEEVRKLITAIDKEEASLLAYARGMLTWHRNHLFCGACGNPTVSQSNGHERKCISDLCGKVAYPRVDPAVIVLIEKDFDGIQKCLLGRSKRYPTGMYSTLAGFVEPGESLEMTVKREMMEEVGIEVTDIRYQASQPWPFPTSLMLGFFATATSTELTLDTDEVEEARWFSREELKALSASGQIHLSRRDSIAHYLITTWMNPKD